MQVATRWGRLWVVPFVMCAAAACTSNTTEPSAPPVPASSAPQSTAAPEPTPTGSAMPPPATTPVPQPSPGDVTSEVPTQPQRSRRPVDLDKSSDAGGNVTARITNIDRIISKAVGPGEVSGPAVALTVEVRNGSDRSVDLDEVVVTLTGADGSPGGASSGAPARALAGQLRPDRTAKGVYVFTVASENRDPIDVQITLTGGGTVLQFRGKA